MVNLSLYACLVMLGFAAGHLLALWAWVPGFGRKKLQRSQPTDAPNTTPHERWPEILRWQKDDVFDCCSSRDVREPAPELIAVSPDGFAYCWGSCLRDNKLKIPVRHLVGRNESLRTREIDEEMPGSAEYMELIKQFNIAYAELQERDKKLKLVS